MVSLFTVSFEHYFCYPLYIHLNRGGGGGGELETITFSTLNGMSSNSAKLVLSSQHQVL